MKGSPLKVGLYTASRSAEKADQWLIPLSLGYLAEIALQTGCSVVVTGDHDTMLEANPDLLGIGSVSQCLPQALELARRYRQQSEGPLVLGGYHVSALPHRLPEPFDVGVLGEGELAFAALLHTMQQHGGLPCSELGRIPGLVYRQDGELWSTGKPQQVEDLDDLPWPKRQDGLAELVPLLTSRGCIYRCAFCANSRHWQGFRQHSAERVLDEITALVAGGSTCFHLLDDNALVDEARLLSLCEGLKERGLSGKVKFEGFISSSLATASRVDLAQRLGFSVLKFGLETGSDRLLHKMKGHRASVANHRTLARLCHERSIIPRATVMLGWPGETEEDLDATLRLLLAERIQLHGIFLATPVPGTKLWRYAERLGAVSEEMDFSLLAGMDLTRPAAERLYLNGDLVPFDRLMEWGQRLANEGEVYA